VLASDEVPRFHTSGPPVAFAIITHLSTSVNLHHLYHTCKANRPELATDLNLDRQQKHRHQL
jgi:hypothetical protein